MHKSNLIAVVALLVSLSLYSQTILEADGPGNTYELINSVLAPGNDVVEVPDCNHAAFGRHITEVWDNQLNQYVFAFHIHVTPDNDRCINFDRQRNEIKTYDKSPAHLLGVTGETVTYKWKFKLPTGFQASSNFTHLHQIKAVGGDESDPIFCLTARKGSPNRMELNYYIDSDLSAVRVASANLSLFENTWVEVTETIKIDNVSGAYSMVIKNVATGVTLLSYSNNNMLTIRKDNQFIRPKWGIYRSLLNPQDLRDEIVHFASFSIYEEKPTAVLVPAQDSNNLLVSSLPNGSASIEYVLDYPSKVTLQLLGMDGKVLESFADNQFQQPGQHTVILSGNEFPGKTGLVRLITDRGQSVTKVLPTN